MARSWPYPPAARTVHLYGDLHFGAVASVRTAKARVDQQLTRMPTPALRIQMGDMCDTGVAGEDTLALGHLGQLPGPSRCLVGNHDMWGVRNGAAAAAAWNFPGTVNWTYDLGFAQVIAVGPDASVGGGDLTTIVLSQTTLDWLDAQLAAATKNCIVACHAPLQNTVLGDTAANWTTDPVTYAGMSVDPDAAIRTILNNRSRAKLFVSGHTHSHVDLQDFLKVESVGTRNILSINSSAIYYTGKTEDLDDPIRSVYLTWTPNGQSVEVRCRDHGSGTWVGINGQRVTTLAIPA